MSTFGFAAIGQYLLNPREVIVAPNGEFDEINEAKANLEHIYDEPDPRAYFQELKKLRYRIPGAAKPIFKKLISHLHRSRRDGVRLLDLGCSYGVNAALLKHDLSMSDLYELWGEQDLQQASSQQVVDRDQQFFADLENHQDIEVIGLDPATNAVEYAEEVGLIDHALNIDLETEALPPRAQQELKTVDMALSTGCVGYVTEQTFDQLLPPLARGRPAWFANFVLRMFPFSPIEDVLCRWGYVTEKLTCKTFPQRRFATSEEMEQVLEKLNDSGVDPSGVEAQGELHAEFYLSRPKDEADKLPLPQLLAA